MSASSSDKKLPDKVRDISVEEFRRSELVNYCSLFIDCDLLVISHRNLHLLAIHREFNKFSRFINQRANKQLLVFLTPVFQHLYLLLLSHKGKSDAERFVRYFKHLAFPPGVLDNLLQCETSQDVQRLIRSSERIRVKLTSSAYHSLLIWLGDSFSQFTEMFNILRVLHENFHIDLYVDEEEEEFAAFGFQMQQNINDHVDHLQAERRKFLSQPRKPYIPFEVTDEMIEKMAKLGLIYERPKHSPTSKPHEVHTTSKMPTTSEPSEKPSTSNPSEEPSTSKPSEEPSTSKPSEEPSTSKPSEEPSTSKPSEEPSTSKPSEEPSTSKPSEEPSISKPSKKPSTSKPSKKPSTSTPSEKSSTSTPSEKFSTSTPSEKSSTSTQSKKSSTSTQSKKSSTSTQSKKSSTSTQSEKSSTSTQSEKSSTSTPSEKSSISTPTEKSSISTPIEKSSTSTPIEKSSTSTPIEKSSTSTPIEKSSTSTPIEKSSTSTPIEKSSTSIPIEKSSTSTPSEKPSTSKIPEKPKISREPLVFELPYFFELPENANFPRIPGSDSVVKFKCSFTELRPTAKIFLEETKRKAKEENWTKQQLYEALLNPPDPYEIPPDTQGNSLSRNDDQDNDSKKDEASVAHETINLATSPNTYVTLISDCDSEKTDSIGDPTGMIVESDDSEKTDCIEDPAATADQSDGNVQESLFDFLDDPGYGDKNAIEKIIDKLLSDNEEAEAGSRLLEKISNDPLNASDVENILASGNDDQKSDSEPDDNSDLQGFNDLMKSPYTNVPVSSVEEICEMLNASNSEGDGGVTRLFENISNNPLNASDVENVLASGISPVNPAATNPPTAEPGACLFQNISNLPLNAIDVANVLVSAGVDVNLMQKFSKSPLNAIDVEKVLRPGLSPFGSAATNSPAGLSPFGPVATSSPADSEYVIISEDSTEKTEEECTKKDDIDIIYQGPSDSLSPYDSATTLSSAAAKMKSPKVYFSKEITDYFKKQGNQEDTEIEDNAEDINEDSNADSKTDAKNDENDELKTKYFEFKASYKSNFHSAYPITISGRDTLCASDVSSDLQYLACAFASLRICTWRLDESLKLIPIGTLKEHTGIVYALSIDSNKKILLSGSHDETVIIWDIEDGTRLSTIKAHCGPVYSVCASPNSKCFLSASKDRTVVLHFYDDVYPVQVYSGHSLEEINCVRFHPNGVYFASASSDGNLFLFKLNEHRRPVRMFAKHMAPVFTLSFSPCGKKLASADVEGDLIIWDILSGEAIKTIQTGQGIRSISYDMNGSFIAALFYYKNWKMFNVADNDDSVVVEAETTGVPLSVHFSEHNKMLIVQFVYADKRQIAESKQKPKTEIKGLNQLVYVSVGDESQSQKRRLKLKLKD